MPINILSSPGLGSGFGQAAYAAGQTQGAERGQQLYGQQLQLFADLQQRQQDNRFRYQQLFQQGALAQQELGARLYSQRLDLQQQEARDTFQARQRMLELGAQQAQQRERDQYEAAVGNFRQQQALAGQFQQHALDAQTNLGRDLFHAQFTADRDVYHARQSDQELQQRFAQADASQQRLFEQQQQLAEMNNQARQERTDTRVGAQGTLAIRQFRNKMDELDRLVADGRFTEEQIAPWREATAQRLAGMTAREARQQQQDQQQQVQQMQAQAQNRLVYLNDESGQRILGPDGRPQPFVIDNHGIPQLLQVGGRGAAGQADPSRVVHDAIAHADQQMEREYQSYQQSVQRAQQSGQQPPPLPSYFQSREAWNAERQLRVQEHVALQQDAVSNARPGQNQDQEVPQSGEVAGVGGPMGAATGPVRVPHPSQVMGEAAQQARAMGNHQLAADLLLVQRDLAHYHSWEALAQQNPQQFQRDRQIMGRLEMMRNPATRPGNPAFIGTPVPQGVPAGPPSGRSGAAQYGPIYQPGMPFAGMRR